jgi:hypothetical protein
MFCFFKLCNYDAWTCFSSLTTSLGWTWGWKLACRRRQRRKRENLWLWWHCWAIDVTTGLLMVLPPDLLLCRMTNSYTHVYCVKYFDLGSGYLQVNSAGLFNKQCERQKEVRWMRRRADSPRWNY